ncbi:MAG: hypothetical protein KY444_10570 [Gemmatimonadetes bacterium]|nr:hypothetical protein [Gemmatimonadota bacterium]
MADYSLLGYGDMMADRVRMDAYAAALEQAVRPGSVVLDIGTGARMIRPRLVEDGRIDRMVLERMEGAATLEEIARELAAAFPARFGAWEAALTHAGRLAEKYGE